LYDIDEKCKVLQPIPIVIEELEEEVVASFPEIETYATGVNEAEAINNLKKSITELYRDLMNAGITNWVKCQRYGREFWGN